MVMLKKITKKFPKERARGSAETLEEPAYGTPQHLKHINIVLEFFNRTLGVGPLLHL